MTCGHVNGGVKVLQITFKTDESAKYAFAKMKTLSMKQIAICSQKCFRAGIQYVENSLEFDIPQHWP